MGTKVAEDLRKKKSKGTKVSRDLRTNPQTWGEYFQDRWDTLPERTSDKFERLGKWKENFDNLYSNYNQEQVQDMRDQSWGSWYSPREGLYDLTGYDYGGKIRDTAAVPLNALSETLKFTGAALKGVPQSYKGFGKGTGYGFDIAMEGMLGTSPLYEDNPMRHTHEDLQPYANKAWDKIDDLMTKDAERLIDEQVDAYADYDTLKYEYPEMTKDQYKAERERIKNMIIADKYYDQVSEMAAKNYSDDMMDQYGIYNPDLLKGTKMGDMGYMGEKMDLGALDPLKEYFMDFGKDKTFDYTSKDAQELLATPEFLGEMAFGMGIPSAGRAALKYGTKKGIPSVLERVMLEALPGTLNPKFSGGYRSTMKNPWLRKPINFLDASRSYGSQYFAPMVIGEMMDD